MPATRSIVKVSRASLILALTFTAVGLWPSAAFAQHDHAAMMAAMDARWKWTVDASGTLNLNVQQRKFTDFTQVESQNWLMLMGGKSVGQTKKSRVSVHAMFSLEPFTLRDLGSSQAFQTGETFDRRPLIDYQHPHDLFMGLSGTWTVDTGKNTKLAFTGAIVGEPTLGPTAFMHRPSSEGNPTAPLSHHTVDSTHITHGVVAAGVTHRAVTIEGSVFRGREPDEDRLDIEMGPLDSYAGRVWFRRNGFAAQVSGGHLKQPDMTEASDLNRYSASVEYSAAEKPIKFTALFGVNHHPDPGGEGTKEFAWLVDVAWRMRPNDLVYLRAELVDKDILEAGGYDPPGFDHEHPLSRVGALTLGYQRRIANFSRGNMGLGSDITVYRTPSNLKPFYGRPISFHVFLIARGSR
jgi:hypothetical protein